MSMDARKLSERDRVYYDDFDDSQWTADQKATLRRRKQPPAVQNWIRIAINGMLGVVERMQTDPKALPRSEDKDGQADVATKALRYIADENRLDRLKVRAARNFFVEGTCAAVIEVEPQRPDYKIVIRRVSHREHFADPFSQEEDYSDARYQGIAKWMDQSVLEAMYPDKAKDIQAALSDASLWSPNDQDRPNKGWVNKRAKRLLVVEMYHQEGPEWQRCVFIGSALLEYGPSPYRDADGKTMCAIEAQSFAKNLDNYAYGAVRSMISTQDMINKRMSKLMHLLNTRQTFGTKAALGEDVSKIKQELASPDGHVELNHGTFGQDFGIIPVNDQVAGQFQLLQNDLSFMDRVLPNPGILGRDNQGQSGVAIQSAQNAGMTELADPFGGLTDWELRIYRQCWARAKQFWTAPRWVRVTDDIGAIEMLQVNVPVVDEIGMPVIDPMTGQPQMQRALAQLDVDIILDAQPEQLTQQAEQFQILANLAAAKVPIPPEVLIQLSGLDGKTKRLAMEALQKQQQMAAQQPPSPDDQQKLSVAELNKAKVVETQLKAGVTVGMAEAGGPPPMN